MGGRFGGGTSSSPFPEPLALNYKHQRGKNCTSRMRSPLVRKSSTAVTTVTAGNTHLLLVKGWKTFTDIVRVGT